MYENYKIKSFDTTKKPIVKHYLVVKHIEPEKTFSEKAIEYGGFGISALSFIVTLLLAKVAFRSLKFNKQQVDASMDAVRAQTNAIENENRRFEIENRSYLEITEFCVLKNENHIKEVNFNLTNFGKFPVLVVNQCFYSFVRKPLNRNIPIDFEELWQQLEKLPKENKNRILTNSKPLVYKRDFQRETGTATSDFPIVSGDGEEFFFYGEIKYKTLLDEKVMYYKFIIHTYKFNVESYGFIYNKNTDT